MAAASVYDFCGTWHEEQQGDSLVPMMRHIHVAESKIQHSLLQQLTLELSYAPSTNELTTVYKEDAADSTTTVSTVFTVDGKWKLSSLTNRLSKCSFLLLQEGGSRLVLEKQVSSALFLRDERWVERCANNTGAAWMRQKLTLHEKTSSSSSFVPMTANRMWKRAQEDADFDSFVGVWELNQVKSQPLEPFLLALKVRKPTFAAQCVRQDVRVCGPRELVFISYSADKSLPAQRFHYSFPKNNKNNSNHVVHATDSASPQLVIQIQNAREGRAVSAGGGEMQQLLYHLDCRVKRTWTRVGKPWPDTLPLLSATATRPSASSSFTWPALVLPRHASASAALAPCASVALLAGYTLDRSWVWLVLVLVGFCAAKMFNLWDVPAERRTRGGTEGWVVVKLVLAVLAVVVFNSSNDNDSDSTAHMMMERDVFAILSVLFLAAVRVDLLECDDRWTALAVLAVGSTVLVFTSNSSPSSTGSLLLRVVPGVLILSRRSIAGVGKFGYFRPLSADDQEEDEENEKEEEEAFCISVTETRINPEGGFAEYLVKFGSGKEVWRRYREFDALRQELGEGKGVFPPKRWLSNTAAAAVESRRVALDAYLKAVFGGQGGEVQDHRLRTFLGLGAV